MPVDTAEERRSVAGLSVGWGITPNTVKDLEWRQQVAWNYSGIATAEEEEQIRGCVHIDDAPVTTVLLGTNRVNRVRLVDAPVTNVVIEDEAC